MKRIRIVYSILIALLILSAFIGCSAPDKRSTAEKSGDCSLTVETVCGVAVNDSQAVLTSEQFSALTGAADVSALCVYTAAEKAEVVVSLDAEELTFTVTAENGTENTYTVTIVVLSGDTSFTLRTFADIPVSSDHITVPEKIWRDMCADADLDILPYFTAETADGAVLNVEFDTKTRRAKFTCVSQDGTQTAVRSYGLQVSVPFGSHTQTGYGSRNSITWSYDHDSYVLSGATAFKDLNGNALADDYAVSFRAALSGYKTDSEMCFAAYEAGNLMIRFYIRVVDSDYISVRTDYRDRSDYKNEILLINKIPYSGGMFSDIKLIVKNNSLVIVYEGETLFRRTLFGLKRTEACIYSNNCTVYLKNIETESDPESVAAQYDNALDGYDESDIGKTLIGGGENMERMEEGPNGEITVNNAASGARVMAGLYSEGVPVGGYEYAVGGKVRITDTKTSGGSASKVEFQIYSSFNDFVKFHLFRFPTNNSFYIYPTVNGKGSTYLYGTQNNMMPTPSGGVYEVEYAFVYDHGVLEAYLKDGSELLPDFTLVYSLETDWGYTGYAFANKQYCNSIFYDTKVYYGAEFDTFAEKLHGATDTDISFENGVFTETADGRFYKTDKRYSSAKLISGGNEIGGEHFVLSGTAELFDCEDWGQSEIIVGGNGRYARYVLEYNKSQLGFQLFTETSTDGENWGSYRHIVSPHPGNAAYCNFTVVNENGKYSFLIDGYVWHTYKNMTADADVLLGGKNSVIKLTRIFTETDEQAVKDFAADMKEHEYVSPYEGRIAALAEQYKNAEKGGILLVGSSSIDYWYTWQEDLGSDILGYNVGIGGTKVVDWMYAYDRLVKPFAPSKIVMFLGGNNVNGGDSAADTVGQLAKLLTRMHTDFPQAEIYYILSMPVPNNYSNGKYTVEYGKLIDGMKQFGAQTDWVTIIDLESELIRNGNPIPEYFKSDNMHLTDAGYKVWTRVIRSYIFRGTKRTVWS